MNHSLKSNRTARSSARSISYLLVLVDTDSRRFSLGVAADKEGWIVTRVKKHPGIDLAESYFSTSLDRKGLHRLAQRIYRMIDGYRISGSRRSATVWFKDECLDLVMDEINRGRKHHACSEPVQGITLLSVPPHIGRYYPGSRREQWIKLVNETEKGAIENYAKLIRLFNKLYGADLYPLGLKRYMLRIRQESFIVKYAKYPALPESGSIFACDRNIAGQTENHFEMFKDFGPFGGADKSVFPEGPELRIVYRIPTAEIPEEQPLCDMAEQFIAFLRNRFGERDISGLEEIPPFHQHCV